MISVGRSREIGSEFWSVPTGEKPCGLFPPGTQWYLSGRAALRAIVSELRDVNTVGVPDWCCDSMLLPFVEAGIEPLFYSALDRYRQDFSAPDCDLLLVSDCFGWSGPPVDHSRVIRDLTHSIFSASRRDANWYFGSLRKWCGFWTGGFAWSDHTLPAETGTDEAYCAMRRRAMEEKARYLAGDEIGDDREAKEAYLRLFAQAEARLERCPPLAAAERDVRLAHHLDAELIRSRRRENAAVLMEAFPELLLFPQLGEEDCPLFVPILVPGGQRDALRRYLIQQEIYCPVHWPLTALHRIGEDAKQLYENELSLVCDQRYTTEDMRRIAEAIRAFRKG